jgi:hypothetical protein
MRTIARKKYGLFFLVFMTGSKKSRCLGGIFKFQISIFHSLCRGRLAVVGTEFTPAQAGDVSLRAQRGNPFSNFKFAISNSFPVGPRTCLSRRSLGEDG